MKSLVYGAAVVFAGALCPVMADVVSFKDAAKIKSWDAWMQLRQLAKRYSPDLDMIQGETGCPAQLEFAHALANREWTEYKQAKYDLRRVFGDAVRDVPSNCFSFIDLQYTFMLQSFGLVRSNALMEFVYRRPSWYAMRNFYALFDDDTKPVSFEERAVGAHTLAIATFKRDGKTLKAFWFSEEMPTDSLDFTRLDLSGDVVACSEWIEMVTGRRYLLDDPRSVPVWDSPCLNAGGDCPHMLTMRYVMPSIPRRHWSAGNVL